MWSKLLTASAAALFGAVGAMAGDLAPVQTATSAEADAIIASEPARAVPKIWAEADYLLWFERRQGVPLLVGTIPDSMVNSPNGLTGAANPLYPTNGKIDFRGINGLSARAGGQLTDVYGLDIGGFVLEKQNVDQSFTSTGTPSLVRTYLQPSSGILQNLFSARIAPNGYPGSVLVHADSRLWGIDGNVRNGFDGIKVHYEIDADATPEQIAALVAQSQKRSAVFDIVANPTDVTVTTSKA